jgi:hypothetical protein
LEAVFLAGALFVAVFLVALPDLLLAFFFWLGEGGILAPERRASLSPIAMACFGFLTFRPVLPDSSWCCLNSCITSPTLPLTIRFDFGSEPEDDLFVEVLFFVAINVTGRFRSDSPCSLRELRPSFGFTRKM